MNSVKCKNCALINFADEELCRRCESPLYAAPKGKSGKSQDKPGISFSFGKIAAVFIVASAAYCFLYGFPLQLSGFSSPDANRIAGQPVPPVGLSRTKYDQQRAGNFANNFKGSPALAAQKKHDEETQKVMQAASNSQVR